MCEYESAAWGDDMMSSFVVLNKQDFFPIGQYEVIDIMQPWFFSFSSKFYYTLC